MLLVKFFASLLLLAAAASAAAIDEGAAAFNYVGEPLGAAVVSTVRQELHAKINSMWVNHPASTVCNGCLVSSWYRNVGSGYGRRVPLSQLDSALSGQPTELAQKVRAIAFAGRVDFQLFRFSVNSRVGSGSYSSYMGVARRSGSNVELAILRADIVAYLVSKYNTYKVTRCRRILWFRRCHTNYYYVLRGYYSYELARIETAMIAEGVRRFREQANVINM